jgi:Na+/proline symporter
MRYYLYIIPAYIFILLIFNIYRSKKIKNQEDYMVAGRQLSLTVMVFTLICTWIGSGTFIAGAEYAFEAGWSSLWMPAGAWLGIVVIYFLAGKIRTFGQYTIGDILEVRYGKYARIIGSIALIISFTAIVSYQFRAGGLILNVLTSKDNNISIVKFKSGEEKKVQDLRITNADVQGNSTLYLVDGKSRKVKNLIIGKNEYKFTTDENPELQKSIPESEVRSVRRFITFKDINNAGIEVSVDRSEIKSKELDAGVSVFEGQLITAIFVIFFTAIAGMMAVAYTDLPNGIIIVTACLISVPFVIAKAGGFEEIMKVLPAGHFAVFPKDFGEFPVFKAIGYFLSTMLLLMGIQSMYQKFYSARSPKEAKGAVIIWIFGTILVETLVVVIAVFGASYFWNKGKDPASIVLLAAKEMVPPAIGVLLLAAACAVVISTAMNYLLSPSTNIMRDIYQRFINPNAEQKKMVRMQKIIVVIFGICAFMVATQLVSVLEMSYFAYTIYGVAITPALIAALSWKRATKLGGLTSILSGTIVCILLKILTYILPPEKVPDGDPFGIPLIYPSLLVSLLSLVVVSYLTPKPKEEDIKQLFPEKA